MIQHVKFAFRPTYNFVTVCSKLPVRSKRDNRYLTRPSGNPPIAYQEIILEFQCYEW